MFSDQALANALSPRLMELILLPTEKCNFRCTYCYEDFAIGRMPSRVITGVKQLIANRVPSLDHLSISWFGGEPLLAKEVCLDISSFAKDLCEKNNVGFVGGFTTNGYLLDIDLFRTLVKQNQTQYQITLDGDEEWHNKTRIQPNRKPTFEKIWHNLTSFRDVEEDFSVSMRLHVHAENIESVKRLYQRIKDTLLTDKRFSVYFHKISNLNPDEQIKETVLNDKDYADALRHISGDGDMVNGRAKSEIHLSDYICYAAKPNSLMVRANGTIGKCTVALNDDRNNLGKILEDGSLEISNPKLRQWMLGYRDMSKETLSCPLSTLPHAIKEAAKSDLALTLVE